MSKDKFTKNNILELVSKKETQTYRELLLEYMESLPEGELDRHYNSVVIVGNSKGDLFHSVFPQSDLISIIGMLAMSQQILTEQFYFQDGDEDEGD